MLCPLTELAGFANAGPGAASPAGKLLPAHFTHSLSLASTLALAGCPSCSAPPSPASQFGQVSLSSTRPLAFFLYEISIKTNYCISIAQYLI